MEKSKLKYMTLSLLVGMLSGAYINVPASSWFSSLIKPELMPPNWVFGPVWTILYISLGLVYFYIQSQLSLKILFFIQFGLNIAWSTLFFYMERIDLALYDLFALWLVTFVMILKSYKFKQAFWLLLPYIAWLTFAFMLNLNIYMLNG